MRMGSRQDIPLNFTQDAKGRNPFHLRQLLEFDIISDVSKQVLNRPYCLTDASTRATTKTYSCSILGRENNSGGSFRMRFELRPRCVRLCRRPTSGGIRLRLLFRSSLISDGPSKSGIPGGKKGAQIGRRHETLEPTTAIGVIDSHCREIRQPAHTCWQGCNAVACK